MKFRQIDEALQFVLTGAIAGNKVAVLTTSFEDRVARAKQIVQDDVTFLTLMTIATDPKQKIEGLKPGFPDQVKLDRGIPAGIADTTVRQELRRIKGFLPDGPYSKVKPVQREAIWTNLLEGMHFREANVLTMIKDQTLLENYPGLEDVLNALNNINTPTTTTTTLAPAAKKVLQTKINISTASSKEKAIAAADIVVETRPAVPPKTPLWLPAGSTPKGGSLLDAALAAAEKKEEAVAPKKAPAKKAPAKKKAAVKTTTSAPPSVTTTESRETPVTATAAPAKKKAAVKKEVKPVETDPAVVTPEEYDELSARSESLQEERNVKMNVITDEQEMMTFLEDWKQHSAKVMKELREEQLNRRKAQ
jgi:hypothetical protein